ncbi:unnamed protein product [Calicophoron daubneyi]|uniref:Rabaptin GTPase-Rab5 binding domain-containing protein n=1 Tax=Calicophoron daubneyi TaxID=300641 RepID=A0AAV2TJ63_CALDB
MLETATDSSVQKAKSLESEINENTNPCVLPVNNTENQASVPDFVHAILLRVAGTDLGDKLTSLLNEKHTELVKCQAQCEYAQKEANDAKNRLSRIEMELDDVRSAAALTVAGQSDMISNIQRHYEEDLASWRSISEQQVAEVRAASQAELDRAKADWDSERKALVICASSNYNSRRDSCNLASAGKGPVEVCRTVSNFDHVNSADIRLRDSPANELPKAPVNGYEVDSKKLTPRPQNQVSEVPPLHQLLASSPKSSPLDRLFFSLDVLGSTAELDLGPCQGSPKHNLMTGTIGAAVTPSVPKNVHTSQTESPAPADGPVTSNCDFKSPVSESSWVQMQSGLKETESRSPVACAMCSNYEHQLQIVQLGLQEKDRALQKSQEESLAKSVQLDSALQRQAELEKELQSRTTSQSEKIEKLETTITRMSDRVENLLTNYRAHRLATEEKLRQLSDERQTLQSNFNTLQLHYDRLLGRRLMASTKLAAQPIHLPSDRSELELFALKTYEENLSLREAREQLDEQLKSDAQFHRQQLTAERQEKVNMETSLQRELDDTRARLASLTDVVSQRDNEMAGRQKAEEEAKEAKIKLEDLQLRHMHCFFRRPG